MLLPVFVFHTESSLPNNLHKHAFAAVAVEFAIENLFPRAEVELTIRDRHHHFPAHDGALEMSVGVVFWLMLGRLYRRILLLIHALRSRSAGEARYRT